MHHRTVFIETPNLNPFESNTSGTYSTSLLLFLQEILIHIDDLNASSVLSADDCRGGDDCCAATASG